RGNCRRDFGEFPLRHRRRAILPEMQRIDQGAMDNKIGVTPDRRGEMRITAQIKTKMPVIPYGIFRLRLGAQHHFIDDMLVVRALYAGKNAVELGGAKNLALAKFDADGGQKFREIVDFFERWLVMHAIDEILVFRFKRFGGRHIRENHEFLDEAVRIEPWRRFDGFYRALLVEDDLAFREVEFERPAFVARGSKGEIGLVKRNENRFPKQFRCRV